ncbi:MAG: GH36-type glycosyl hydrolase domain-containing protein [Pseudomonadota bacterium]
MPPPLRAVLFGQERFHQHGISLAQAQPVERRHGRRRKHTPPFFPRLQDNLALLKRVRAYLETLGSQGDALSPAAEWLLDNFHLIEAQIPEIRTGMPPHYYAHLPKLRSEPLAGLPRIYGIAWAFVAHTDSSFDAQLLQHFLQAYQEVDVLTLGELWALPTTLRVVLVENLARLAETVAANKAARELANSCCDHPEAIDENALNAICADLERRGVQLAFLAQMHQRLLHEPLASEPPDWAGWLHERVPDGAAQLAEVQAQQAANNVSVSHAVNALRAINNLEWSALVDAVSPVLGRLRQSPAFCASSELTRDQCTHAIERLAQDSRRSEVDVADAALRLAEADEGLRALGPAHFLIGPGRSVLAAELGIASARGDFLRRNRWALYIGSVVLGTVLLMQAALAGEALVPWAELLTVALLAFPASECVLALLHRLLAESVPVHRLPRLGLEQGLQPEQRTLVVVPCILHDTEAVQELAHRLEQAWLANREQQVQFALLSDWADAAERQAARDKLVLDAAQAAIGALNARHPASDDAPGPRFLLLHRERSWSDSEHAWIGWERKRGKLEQLVAHLAGASASPFIDLGEASRIMPGVAYVVTLDADTRMPPGTLRQLVAVAAHPLNAPRLDPHTRRVVAGYGVLQPRIAAPIPQGGAATPFAWLHSSSHWGLDAYSSGSSEVYQDVFGEGSFAGKGLLHVHAFHAALQGRVPEGRLLSHDLFEGIWARCAYLSDVALLEPQPLHPDADASRQHRWTRGDWQLLPFLGAALHGRVGALNLWKMLDNLRRSLLAPACVALLWMSFALETVTPLRAAALVFAAFALGPLLGGLACLVPGRSDAAGQHLLRQAGRQIAAGLLAALWRCACLMHDTLLRLDAIARALWRLGVSRRHLLQWTTAAQAEARAPRDLPALLRHHAPTSAAAALWLVCGLLARGSGSAWLVATGLLWLLTPCAVWLASQPFARLRRRPPLSDADAGYLHDVARDTWRLFELAVGPQDHHLPPDNLQTEPRAMLAHRTSPTNIGLYLLAVVCARRLGFIGTTETVERLANTLDTLDKLPRFRGHFYNWTDTQSLQTLTPAYVSTVDSGNLAGHLWAVAEACREMASTPAPHEAMGRALRAAARRLQHRSDPALAELLHQPALRALLDEDLWALWRRDPARLRTLLDAAQAAWRAATQPAAQSPDAGFAPARPELQPLADLLRQLDSLLRDREADRDRWGPALRDLAQRADALANAMDFSFLYDAKRRLFHIGYRPADAALDGAYYDLLASEARLASFVAIAKGDAPRQHWAALGRPFAGVNGRPTLQSWSGSMFEYLMPSIVMDEPPGGLLERTTAVAVQAQREFADTHGVPWGVSECAYFAQDHTLAFQYSAFGVPRLALRRTPPDERVVAPYATVLAALVDPAAAVANLKRLERLGARGLCGFIEAMDFTRNRLREDGRPQQVATFMAHHQGMSLVALANLLADGAPRRWFSLAPLAQAHAPLLQERLPREIVYRVGEPPYRPPLAEDSAAVSAARSLDPGDLAHGLPPTQLLGNGSYSVALRPSGAGASRWRGHAVSRWRDDALRDAYGTWLMLRREDEVEFHSLTRSPNPRPDAHYRTRFYNDRVEFDAECDEWEARVAVWVSPDDDVEFRRVQLHNLAGEAVAFDLLSWFEVALARQRADESHPAFSNLFVQAHAADPRGVLLERRPRLDGEPSLWAAHFLATSDIEPVAVRITCDRARLLPRLGHVAQARPGASQTARADGLLETGLDPVASLAVRLVVPAQARVEITFATAAAQDSDTLLGVVDKYRQDVHLQRARLMSATLTRIRHRELRVEPADIHAMQDLTTLMLATCSRERRPPEVSLDRRVLWRFGISGDLPLLLVRINTALGLAAVQALLTAQRLWENAGLPCDLVVLNGEPPSYLTPLQDHIHTMRLALGAPAAQQPDKGGVHVLKLAEVTPAEIAALQAYARADLLADGRPLARLLAQALSVGEPPSRTAAMAARGDEAPLLPDRRQRAAIAEAPSPDEVAPNRFSEDGREFEIQVDSLRVTPRPWVNVLANPQFGCIVSESGSGFTWARNSRMNQLTGWSNDPLLDPPSEHFLVQDLATRELWGLLPTLDRNGVQGYRVTHTQGESRFAHERPGLGIELRIAVHPREPAKLLQVKLHNTGLHERMLRLVGMVEWVLGAQRGDRMTVATEFVPEVQAVLARQLEHQGGFGRGTAFLMLAGATAQQWTCARDEFFDSLGRLHLPRALGGASGMGLDPCGALDACVLLPPGASFECHWVLGYGDDRGAALALAERLRAPGALQGSVDRAVQAWDRRLRALTVRTPDPLFDAMVNRWLPYQTVACRLWAKAGFYQAGGATGFRDQLQDAMALVYSEPEALRAQILLHASRQFREGDVQHWWHSPTGAGVRTRFSDDLLWLPYAMQHYLAVTGERSLLDDEAPFLEGEPVPEDREDVYAVPALSEQRASLYEHGARAIDRALGFGVHGLPLMGTGDWNDGMNRVGHEGKGESVWLGWFLLMILRAWQPLAHERGDEAHESLWAEAQQGLETALRKHGWDGSWYRRAYFDNGHPLGSHLNAECKIDLIAQAWSVFASPPGDDHARQAMECADARLVDRRVGVIRLLDPPLQHQADNAGYIQAYPPGVRENGGQYNHAAVWALMAQAQLGRADRVAEYFNLLSPAHRARTPAAQRRYRIEPYVMPGDVYSVAPYEGRGGWSWYTGSAAWLYRAAIESMMGLVLRADRLCFRPCLPPDWPQAELTLRLRGRVIKARLQVGAAAAAPPAPEARQLAVGEWVALDSLPEETVLIVNVPAVPPSPSEPLAAPAAVEA